MGGDVLFDCDLHAAPEPSDGSGVPPVNQII
jgi:hypothetical protein